MPLHGHLDVLTHRRVEGWAWDPDEPGVQCFVLVVAEDGRVLGRGLAGRARPDLVAAQIGDGRHGFELSLPAKLLSPRKGYAISVRREGDGAHLPGSPFKLEPAMRVVRPT